MKTNNFLKKIWKVPWVCMSPLHRGQASLCTVPILVRVLPKRAQIPLFYTSFLCDTLVKLLAEFWEVEGSMGHLLLHHPDGRTHPLHSHMPPATRMLQGAALCTPCSGNGSGSPAQSSHIKLYLQALECTCHRMPAEKQWGRQSLKSTMFTPETNIK